MKTLLRLLFIALIPGLCLPATAAEKYALLIGVSKYEHAQMNRTLLKYPEADAKAVGELLKKSGYTVVLLLGKQATQTAIKTALNKAESEGTSEGVVLIGMFGHGVQYGNDAYYGPFNTKIREVKDSQGNAIRDTSGEPKLEPDPDSMIAMRSILDALTVCGAESKILLADCCREDPSAARGRAFGSNLQKEGLPRGMAALFACSENEQAFESDDWGHGAFTKALLDECTGASDITANSLSDALYRRVGSLVKEKTNGRDRQTVNGIINGFVDLRIVPSSMPDLITNTIGMKLKLIPAGEFLMGSPETEEGRNDDEGPQHSVRLTQPFYMGVTEVTQGQWFAVMKTKPWEGKKFVQEGDQYPAVYVNWNDAIEYCTKIGRQEGKSYRLPTEAEWEYAARARSTTAYSFGNTPQSLTDYEWFDENAYDIDEKYAHIVGTKKPNPYGLHDMHGNVWEWCSDRKEDYTASAAVDPPGPLTGSYRVSRGGSWSFSARYCRSADRGAREPLLQNGSVGFRLALSPYGQ